VVPGGDRDLELGADAVGGGDEDRILVARGLQIEKCAEAAETRVAAQPRRRLGERLDRLDQSVSGIDVDAGIAVILPLYGALARDTL
jgi:hypothetical protein